MISKSPFLPINELNEFLRFSGCTNASPNSNTESNKHKYGIPTSSSEFVHHRDNTFQYCPSISRRIQIILQHPYCQNFAEYLSL